LALFVASVPEEAMAESYAQLRVHGMRQVVIGIRFPIQGG
jgi:hypothetical protein